MKKKRSTQDTYLQIIDEAIQDDESHINFKWVVSKLDIPSNRAKEVLQEYLNTHKKDSLFVTYLVSGIAKGTKMHTVCLLSQSQMNKIDELFEQIMSKHIYSIGKFKPVTISDLYDSNSHAGYNVKWNAVKIGDPVTFRTNRYSVHVVDKKPAAMLDKHEAQIMKSESSDNEEEEPVNKEPQKKTFVNKEVENKENEKKEIGKKKAEGKVAKKEEMEKKEPEKKVRRGTIESMFAKAKKPAVPKIKEEAISEKPNVSDPMEFDEESSEETEESSSKKKSGKQKKASPKSSNKKKKKRIVKEESDSEEESDSDPEPQKITLAKSTTAIVQAPRRTKEVQRRIFKTDENGYHIATIEWVEEPMTEEEIRIEEERERKRKERAASKNKKDSSPEDKKSEAKTSNGKSGDTKKGSKKYGAANIANYFSKK
jgi:hypothetical protein